MNQTIRSRRFLFISSNMFNIEGVIATISYRLPNKRQKLEIKEVIRAFAKVRDNLALHQQGFPTSNELLDIQNDFAARMDWCLNDYEKANHYPEILLDMGVDLQVKSGEKISIDASGSFDPDGDDLKFE